MIARNSGKNAIPAEVRCHLFYGADDSGSRSLAARLIASFGTDIERVDITAGRLKADPTLLADEAASVSLFGGRRCVRVDGAGDDCLAAVENLLAGPPTDTPVVLIAGALKKDSKLLKRLAEERSATITASYPPDVADLTRIAAAHASEEGVRLDGDAAEALVGICNGDRGVMRQEIEKLAAYLNASAGEPRSASAAAIDAIGAGMDAMDGGPIVDALCSGDVRMLETCLSGAASDNGEAVPLVRAALRRFVAMAGVRAEMARGADARTAGDRAARGLFWRDRESVVRDVGRWSAAQLAIAVDRLGELERTLKSSRSAGAAALPQQFHAIARVGARNARR